MLLRMCQRHPNIVEFHEVLHDEVRAIEYFVFSNVPYISDSFPIIYNF